MTNNFKNTIDSYLSSEIGKLFIRYKNEAKVLIVQRKNWVLQ